jgi:hypothetical protein
VTFFVLSGSLALLHFVAFLSLSPPPPRLIGCCLFISLSLVIHLQGALELAYRGRSKHFLSCQIGAHGNCRKMPTSLLASVPSVTSLINFI